MFVIVSFSYFLSIAAVASSKTKMGASFSTARTSEIFCFCPPDNLWPLGPTSEL
ncbi:hypothetical protein ECANGB1_2716 [Enterospora canceri]|uniref:Uncharacterized protein n=1 Tax=Enterospora canceri TaxID=1081671 RepID=A0A1Y1S597_9MICR|nr:hypothetical protein ECANGB1_2716 [Enterospora canceri]